MSKKIQYTDGFIGAASDKVAEKLAKKPGHKIVGDAEKPVLPKIEKKAN